MKKKNKKVVDYILHDLGVLIDSRAGWLCALRAVRNDDGTYGIILNKLSEDLLLVGPCDYLYDDLNCDSLLAKWNIKRQNKYLEWREDCYA